MSGLSKRSCTPFGSFVLVQAQTVVYEVRHLLSAQLLWEFTLHLHREQDQRTAVLVKHTCGHTHILHETHGRSTGTDGPQRLLPGNMTAPEFSTCSAGRDGDEGEPGTPETTAWLQTHKWYPMIRLSTTQETNYDKKGKSYDIPSHIYEKIKFRKIKLTKGNHIKSHNFDFLMTCYVIMPTLSHNFDFLCENF